MSKALLKSYMVSVLLRGGAFLGPTTSASPQCQPTTDGKENNLESMERRLYDPPHSIG